MFNVEKGYSISDVTKFHISKLAVYMVIFVGPEIATGKKISHCCYMTPRNLDFRCMHSGKRNVPRSYLESRKLGAPDPRIIE